MWVKLENPPKILTFEIFSTAALNSCTPIVFILLMRCLWHEKIKFNLYFLTPSPQRMSPLFLASTIKYLDKTLATDPFPLQITPKNYLKNYPKTTLQNDPSKRPHWFIHTKLKTMLKSTSSDLRSESKLNFFLFKFGAILQTNFKCK